MGRVLVVDDTAICREPLAAALRLRGHEVLTAANGAEALEHVRQSAKVDLMLLDLAMPVMDGLTCLKGLREIDEGRAMPVILLTASGDKANITAAVQFGVRDYLLKSSFSLDDLFARIAPYVQPAAPKPAATAANASAEPTAPATSAPPSAAAASAPPPPKMPPVEPFDVEPAHNGAVRDAVLSNLILAASDPIRSTAIAACENTDSGHMELVNALRNDPGIVLALMKSSPQAGSKSHPMTIDDVIRKVGRDDVCKIVRDLPSNPAPAGTPWRYDPRRYVAHSILTANLLTRCCPVTDVTPRGAPQAAGILHNLAAMLARQVADINYAGSVYAAVSENISASMAERQVLGTTLPALCQEVVDQLGLHPTLAAAIIGCYKLAGAEAGAARSGADTVSPLARALRICSMLASAALGGPDVSATVQGITGADIAGAMLSSLPEAIDLDRMAQDARAGAGLGQNAEGDQTSAELPRRERRVWLARHPSFRDPDPIALLLRQVAHVVVNPRLPRATEVRGFQVVMVISQTGDEPGFSSVEVDNLRRTRPGGISTVWQVTTSPQPASAANPWRAAAPLRLRQLSDMLMA